MKHKFHIKPHRLRQRAARSSHGARTVIQKSAGAVPKMLVPETAERMNMSVMDNGVRLVDHAIATFEPATAEISVFRRSERVLGVEAPDTAIQVGRQGQVVGSQKP